MIIHVNDRPREIAEAATVHALLTELALAGRSGLAVAVNDAVVPRSVWAARPLAAGDRVVLIVASQGG